MSELNYEVLHQICDEHELDYNKTAAAIRELNRRAPAAEQPDMRVRTDCGHNDVDGSASAETVRRIEATRAAEQQQQEPVSAFLERLSQIRDERNFPAHLLDTVDEIAEWLETLYTHQQPQAPDPGAGQWNYFVGNANGRGLIRLEVDGRHVASMPRGLESEAYARRIVDCMNGEQPQAQGEPRKGWWCPTCNISPSGNEVTYQEFHQICGTYIGDAEPPSQPRAAVPDLLPIIMRYCADTMYMDDCRNMQREILEQFGLELH